jgi:hypothetical protein
MPTAATRKCASDVIKLHNNHMKFLLNAMSTNNNKLKFHKAKVPGTEGGEIYRKVLAVIKLIIMARKTSLSQCFEFWDLHESRSSHADN